MSERARQAVDDVIEDATPSPTWVRRRYASVQEAAQHLQLLYRCEDTGASGFDPQRASETAGVDTSTAGYQDVGDDRVLQINDLEAAFRAAWRRTCREYEDDIIQNHPDDLWQTWWAVRMEQRDKEEVGQELGVTGKAVHKHYLDRIDGYTETALKARDLWIEDARQREEKAGYKAKQDHQQEDWTDGD